MAGRTTALTVVGDYSTGPFATREWKARHTIALFEKHRPVWVTSPIGPSEYGDTPQEPVVFPFGWSLAQELVVVIAATAVQDSEVLSAFTVEGLTVRRDGLSGISRELVYINDSRADGPPLPTSFIKLAASKTRDVVRLGLVRLDPGTSLGDSALVELRGYGLDVDNFRLANFTPNTDTIG